MYLAHTKKIKNYFDGIQFFQLKMYENFKLFEVQRKYLDFTILDYNSRHSETKIKRFPKVFQTT